MKILKPLQLGFTYSGSIDLERGQVVLYGFSECHFLHDFPNDESEFETVAREASGDENVGMFRTLVDDEVLVFTDGVHAAYLFHRLCGIQFGDVDGKVL